MANSIESVTGDIEVQVVLYYESRAIHRGAGRLDGASRLRLPAPYPPFALNTYVEVEFGRRAASRKRARRLPAVVAELTPERMDLRLECSPQELSGAIDLSFPGDRDKLL